MRSASGALHEVTAPAQDRGARAGDRRHQLASEQRLFPSKRLRIEVPIILPQMRDKNKKSSVTTLRWSRSALVIVTTGHCISKSAAGTAFCGPETQAPKRPLAENYPVSETANDLKVPTISAAIRVSAGTRRNSPTAWWTWKDSN